MWLLNSGTPEKRSKLKIVYYGQSIIDDNNPWPKEMTAHLREKYPNTDIEPVYTLAVGGYSTQLLAPLTPMDMKLEYPDLVITMVSGSHHDYDALVKYTKENTTADVMILTGHVGNGGKQPNPASWGDRMANELLPEIAKKYGAEACTLLSAWRDYLIQNDLDENLFLSDGTHLNANGQALIFSFVKQFFVHDDEAATAAGKVLENEWLDVGADSWKDGVLELSFTGNRVEVFAEGADQPLADVQINGKKPSEWVELYAHTRIGHGWLALGFLRRLDIKIPHAPQEWTLAFTKWERISESEEKGKQKFAFAYTVSGAEAGLLGASTDGTFAEEGNVIEGGDLDSAIFKINGKDFFFGFNKPAPDATYVFETRLLGTDVYDGSSPLLFSGLPVGEHTFTLTAKDKDNLPNIKRVRIFNPALKPY